MWKLISRKLYTNREKTQSEKKNIELNRLGSKGNINHISSEHSKENNMVRKSFSHNKPFIIVMIVMALVGFIASEYQKAEKGESGEFSIYQKGNQLMQDETVLLDDVIDYCLTSLDDDKQHVLVLQGERSDNVDLSGYEKGLSEGHTFGGYLRFYEIAVEDSILMIGEKRTIKLNQIYENDFTLMNPWCIDAGHMDDDGILEIFVGAYRATEVYETDRRPFIFEWRDNQLVRFWTGSYLNFRTYYEAGFFDYDGDGYVELYAVQPDYESYVDEANAESNGEAPLATYYYKKGVFTFYEVGKKNMEK